MLIVLAVKDRAVRVETGYDLEGIITDGMRARPAGRTMVPFFRNGDYGGDCSPVQRAWRSGSPQARNVTLDNVPQPSAPVRTLDRHPSDGWSRFR